MGAKESPEEEFTRTSSSSKENEGTESLSSSSLSEEEHSKSEQNNNTSVVRFLDSADSYLLLMDSLSSSLRQGWLELASARHSMGASRINSALFDLKYHAAATSLEVDQHNAGCTMKEPCFTLYKWSSPHDGKLCSEEAKFMEDELLQRKPSSKQLRHRSASQYSEIQEKIPESDESESNVSQRTVDDQVRKERLKSLSMFGTLVCPKLRASQLSFERALETLVEIANKQSSMKCAYDRVKRDFDDPTR